jgi:hypothetical protein
MNMLVVDIRGTCVKILAARRDMPRQCESGPMA